MAAERGSGRNGTSYQLEPLTKQDMCCFPNRNLAHCMDVSADGFIAFGSENKLLIVEQPSLTYRYQFVFDKDLTGESTSRVTVVRFAREQGNLLMCATEHSAYFFNLETLKLEREMLITNEEPVYGKISAGDWRLMMEENKMVSAFGTDSSNGYIAVRMIPNSESDSLTWFSASLSPITCLEICQHDTSMIAIGTRNGAVCVCNWMTRSSIHFMDNGDEVTSLAWSPKFDRGFFRFCSMKNQSPVPDEYVLLTSSKDGYLRFWSLAEGFMYTGHQRIHAIRSFNVERNKQMNYNRYNKDIRRRWVTVCWNNQRPMELYYTDFSGAVNCLNVNALFNKEERSLVQWFKKPSNSNRTYTFCLRYCSSKDVVVQSNEDKKINVYSASSRILVGTISTDTGSVTCLAINSEPSSSNQLNLSASSTPPLTSTSQPENATASNGPNAQGGFSEGPNKNADSVPINQYFAPKPKIVLIPTSKDLTVKSENIVIKPILVKKFKYKETTLFDYTSRYDYVEPKLALQDVLTLLELSSPSMDSKGRKNVLNDKPYLNFYLDQKGAMSMFRDEIDEQLSQGDPNVAAVLAAASGMIPRLARLASENSILNQFIASLTASDSGSNTKNVTFSKYACQLNGEKEYLKASSFYFGAFDARNGIRCLLDAKCYRDAVLAARIRLLPADELYIEAHDSWASKFVKDRYFEAAAKCFISANDYVSAADVLTKRESPEAMQVAVKLALKGNKKDVAVSTGIRCIYTSMIDNAWSVGLSVVDLCPELEPWRFVIYLHEGLLFILTQALAPLMIDAFQSDLKIFGNYVHNFNDKNFIHSMWHLWLNRGLSDDPEHLAKMVVDLTVQSSQASQSMTSLKSILPSIAVSLSTGLFNLLIDPWKSHSLFASSLESVSLFTDVSKVISTMVNDYVANDEANKCCAVDAALISLSTGAVPSATTDLAPAEDDEKSLGAGGANIEENIPVDPSESVALVTEESNGISATINDNVNDEENKCYPVDATLSTDSVTADDEKENNHDVGDGDMESNPVDAIAVPVVD